MKKNKKIFHLQWKKARISGILLLMCTVFFPAGGQPKESDAQKIARLEAENQRLKSELEFRIRENAAVRKELIETLDKYSTQAGILRRMQAGSAGTIETLEPVYLGARAMELASDLNQTISFMRKFSASVLTFTQELESSLSEWAKSPVEAARIRVRMDPVKALARDAALFSGPALPPGRFTGCRILEVNQKMGLLVLSGGYRGGVRNGMLLYSGKTGVKVVAVRSFVSAAVLIEGNWSELSPGKWLAPEVLRK